MLQTLNFTSNRLINFKATFFRYESGTAGGADESIRVRADGNDLGVFQTGDAIELPGAASTWEITAINPATTGILRLGMGKVHSARLSGSVRVVDEITDAIQSSAVAGPTTLTSFTVQQLVAPATNVNGILMRMASCGGAAGAGGSTTVRIVAAKSVPTAYFVPSQCYQLVENFNAQTTDVGTTQRMNKRLPPGWGIYLIWNIKDAAPSTGPSGVVQYELQ
ncbi:hypothetical protein ACNI65_09990 [Roseateles sp. So40a]|uniref:hypothetical protein n=1 Tax=Roseateles sp. So40a TaxID=3400226 RepID=UPI003A86A71E